MKDETHFEVVESGQYVILLLGKALSVVWDHRLSISVTLKRTYQVSGFLCLLFILPVTCCFHLLQLPEKQPTALVPTVAEESEWSQSGLPLHTNKTMDSRHGVSFGGFLKVAACRKDGGRGPLPTLQTVPFAMCGSRHGHLWGSCGVAHRNPVEIIF